MSIKLTQDCRGCGDYPCHLSERHDTNGHPLCWTPWKKFPPHPEKEVKP